MKKFLFMLAVLFFFAFQTFVCVFQTCAADGFSMDGLEFDEESGGSAQEKSGRLSRMKRYFDERLRISRMRRNPLWVVPSVWPVHGGISSVFGPRKSPFTGKWRFHAGIDIAAPSGKPVIAPGPGYVIFCGKDGGYGFSVEIAHWGGIVTRHAHLSRILVKNGQVLSRGDRIGLVGSTGVSTGPHLHYEVMVEGVQVNPMRYILD